MPVPVGSISDLVFLTEKNTTEQEINQVLTKESATDRYREVMRVTTDPIVSSDIIGDTHAAIIEIFSWYDNEWGYTNQMVRRAQLIAQSL